MRVVGVDSYRDEDDDGGLSKTERYNEYLARVRPSLPPSVAALLDLSVHDSLVEGWRLRDDHAFELTFVTENVVENTSRITLVFSDATVVANDTDPVETLRLLDGGTELLTSEFDVVDDGRYRFQIMMTPTGEMAITFSDVSIHRAPATDEQWRELRHRPNSGRWGREADAWFVELPPLHRAAARGQVDVVAALLASGASVREADGDTGWTGLHAAASRLQVPVMDALLRAGVEIDRLDAVGQTALGLTARDEDWRGVEFLVNAGANVNLGGDFDFPLGNAASAGNVRSLGLLIRAGADIHRRNTDGWTVLMTATETDSIPLVEFLLAAGADRNATTADGRSAADIAHSRKQPDLARLLEGGTA
jgi:hypothetical protein